MLLIEFDYIWCEFRLWPEFSFIFVYFRVMFYIYYINANDTPIISKIGVLCSYSLLWILLTWIQIYMFLISHFFIGLGVEPLWDEIVAHFLEVTHDISIDWLFHVLFELILEMYLQLTSSTNQHLRNLALHALDQSISAVLGSDEFQKNGSAELRVPSKKVEQYIYFD